MKNRITLLLMAWMTSISFAWAQTFEFQYHGETVADNQTVTIPAVEDEYGFGELWCVTNPSSNPNNGLILKLLNGTSANGFATLVIEHNTLDASTVQWCMGGKCSPMNNKTTLDKDFTVEGSTLVHFDATNIRSEGYLLAKLTATIGSETHTVNIEFTNGQSAGLNDAMTNRNEKVNVYDTFGRLILRHAEKNSINQLPPAIYIIENSKTRHKLLIK